MAIELEDGKGVLFSNSSEAFNGRIKIRRSGMLHRWNAARDGQGADCCGER